MSEERKRFVIIDAMALAYKAYFAFINRPLTTTSGEPISAVFGFLNQLFKIIEDTKPDYLAVAFDSKEKTFRHEMYEKYKSSRSEMPEDMIPQIHRIKEIVGAFNFPLYIAPGYEADDLIGTAVKKAEALGLEAFAVTPDKDYIQLITDNIKVVKPGKSNDEINIIDTSKVLEEYGFSPIQMIDYLALVGDSSDDIPGVAGIGPKSALPLITEFGTVENIYENLDSISKKGIKTKLENSKDNALLSKKLATIVTDAPLEFNIESTKFESPDTTKLYSIFAALEFKTFISKSRKMFNGENAPDPEFEAEEISTFDKTKVRYHLVKDISGAQSLSKLLSKQSIFIFDTETDSLDVMHANLAGASFAIKPSEAYFVPIDPNVHGNDLFAKQLDNRISLTDFKNIFSEVFQDASIKKVCQNGKFDIAVLRTNGINVKSFYFDTMLASYVLDPDQKHGMDPLSQKYLNYQPIPISEIIGSKKDPTKIFDADLQQLSDYACEDADITFHLYSILQKELKKNNLTKLAYDVEFPLVEVLEEMERNGVKVDKNALASFSNYLTTVLGELTSKIHKEAGDEFNINSTKQLQHILFEKLQLPSTKKTKTGYSTDAKALESLKGANPIIDDLLEYRQISKLKSTYADALPKLINPDTGRLHTSFNQTIASTGRLSSTDPNLQNIPIRTELGKEIRKAFIPRNKDYIIFSADYSQIELRIMASICKDENLMNAFINGEDIHRSTAAHVFMVPQDEVTPDMRRKAKEVNFGILYGIGPFGLKSRLGITQTHAKEIIETYFSTFASVKNFIDSSVAIAKEKGYAETLLGRRRFLQNINSSNRVVRQFEERVAVNMPIQGTAADMIKIAMINVHEELQKRECRTKMILQVHDELIFDAHKDEIDELAPEIIEIMENAMKLNVPLKVDTGIGANWLEAH